MKFQDEVGIKLSRSQFGYSISECPQVNYKVYVSENTNSINIFEDTWNTIMNTDDDSTYDTNTIDIEHQERGDINELEFTSGQSSNSNSKNFVCESYEGLRTDVNEMNMEKMNGEPAYSLNRRKFLNCSRESYDGIVYSPLQSERVNMEECIDMEDDKVRVYTTGDIIQKFSSIEMKNGLIECEDTNHNLDKKSRNYTNLEKMSFSSFKMQEANSLGKRQLGLSSEFNNEINNLYFSVYPMNYTAPKPCSISNTEKVSVDSMNTFKRCNAIMNKPTRIDYNRLKCLIFDAPTDDNLFLYIQEMRDYGVTDLVRTCEGTYADGVVVAAGIRVHELIFPDGEAPNLSIIEDWLVVVNHAISVKGAIAVHCVAGLGRAPVLVAVALIEKGMDPLDAIMFIRERRKGAINRRQLNFLKNYKRQSTAKLCCLKSDCVIM